MTRGTSVAINGTVLCCLRRVLAIVVVLACTATGGDGGRTGSWKSQLPSGWKVQNELPGPTLQRRWSNQRAATGRPKQCYVLLVVAPWCATCQAHLTSFVTAKNEFRTWLDSSGVTRSAVKNLAKAHFYVVDGDRNDVAEHYNVTYYPTLLADCGNYVVPAEGLGGVMDFLSLIHI